MAGHSKTIKVDYLARVEGEGALHIDYDDSGVQKVQLKIFEPPRFFEALLRGRDYLEAPDITARICGICPVAYQMSAVHGMEDALGIKPSGALRELRRLLYCGEWIESHMLHISMLHAPDFLGYPNAVAMAKDHPEVVKNALEIKKAGNALVRLIGGREVHPINVRVGGFYKVPENRELTALAEQLETARDLAEQLVIWSSTLPFPNYEWRRDNHYEFVALKHPTEYPMNEGRITSSKGLDITARDYENYFEEEHLAHSTALHCTLKNRGAYLVGPIARFNLNRDKLSPRARQLAESLKVAAPCLNPFQSILVRSLEVLHAFEEALRIIGKYQKPEEPHLATKPKAASGCAATEAPRGLLYHRYDIDKNGKITVAKIVAPTSQNQKTIEDDLRLMLPSFMHFPEDKLRGLCERAIRNYDPCISCSTHFLQLHLNNGQGQSS
ncbi:Ni/Fe hydrogenase subunit alpha [Microbulbifer sp. A4B17]|uniref:Ni/Fe hydrogenase subunit alpha n=1 Tax=Microbulbifer sp. A4B17 TaxID=359370 RepID=UPI000D52A9DC|nr:Ni/Fe hydrogenase subunit alpha [Microbulbifer sp. A4B17]AWF81384.1 Ni/Fe hydrogenase subunit alpha [Microbulbifer sp. A4B17]